MKTYRPFQKILVGLSFVCYLAGIGCGIAAAMMDNRGSDPVVASLMASLVFFVGVGVVLQVIGRTNLPDLKVH